MIIMDMQTLGVLCIKGRGFYAYGINRYNIDLKFKSIHAEVEAIDKLKISEKAEKINMLVFRVNNKGDKLMMAKPCENCCNYIKGNLYKKNYKLKGGKCWFTDERGELDYVKI